MFFEVRSSKSVTQIAGEFEAAAKAQGFGTLTTYDMQAKLREKGVAFESQCRVFEICDPKKAKVVLESDARMVSLLPCRIAVHDIGGVVTLSTVLPSMMLPPGSPAALRAAATDVESRMKTIIESLR